MSMHVSHMSYSIYLIDIYMYVIISFFMSCHLDLVSPSLLHSWYLITVINDRKNNHFCALHVADLSDQHSTMETRAPSVCPSRHTVADRLR